MFFSIIDYFKIEFGIRYRKIDFFFLVNYLLILLINNSNLNSGIII